MRRKIAVITPDVLAGQMAGPAIRAVNIAEALCVEHDVTLISTARCDVTRDEFRCRYASGRKLKAAVGDAEVVIMQGFVSYRAPWLLSSDKILVLDMYDPLHFEQLAQLSDDPAAARRTASVDLTTRVLNEQLMRGDFFLCASDQQRHLWLGQLAAVGRINPANYARDASLHSLIAVCPFGIPTEPPRRTGVGIRGAFEGIGPDDKVVLWAGGVYNWFDPLTLVNAVDRVRADHDNVRLFFLGMKHPNPDVPAMAMALRTRQRSDSLGLTGTHVFFNEGWVPYDERANFLLDADAGVSTHLLHVETAFAFRTRILDYLWAGLPIVSTEGDSFGELVASAGLGVRVPEGDVAALAEAITMVLYDDEFATASRAAVAQIRARFYWPIALAPLVEFCREPRRAADADADLSRLVRRPIMPTNRVARLYVRGSILLHEGGMSLLRERVRSRLNRRRSIP
jgi:glycosyltransferase involved in cell wall biosynthesis